MNRKQTVTTSKSWGIECSKVKNTLPIMSIGIALILLLSAPSLQAQCPTGFLGPFTTTMTVPSCPGVTMQVKYCIPGPTVFPSNQYHILQVTIPTGSGCALTGQKMREIAKVLIAQNALGLTCNGNCPAILGAVQVSSATCWTVNQETGEADPCPVGANQGCADLFQVCCRCDGTLTAFYQATVASDQCEYETGCTTLCSGPSAPDPVVCP